SSETSTTVQSLASASALILRSWVSTVHRSPLRSIEARTYAATSFVFLSDTSSTMQPSLPNECHNSDMRYENPLYLAEEAAALDLIADGRVALGISRGSPEPADRGWEAFGYTGSTDP